LSGYLRPTAPIAADALLVADPGAAMAIAQLVLEKPLMANHNHGLWGYSGTTSTDRALTVQSTGIGGPSTAAIVSELGAHGVSRAIRVGACVPLDPALEAGAIVVAETALGLDGTSAALGSARPAADPELTAALADTLGAERATIAGYDLAIEAAAPAVRDAWIAAGARVADNETAALLAIAERSAIAVAAALIVAPSDDELVELAERAALALTSA
jgi:uridine phosphorylase